MLPRRPSPNERPVKLDMNFREAIRFLSTPPAERAKRKDSPVAESGNTTTLAPGPDPAEPQTSDHRTLFDFLPDSQTPSGTSEDGGR